MAASFKAFPPRWGHVRVPTTSRPAALSGLALYAPCRPLGRAVHRLTWLATRLVGPRAIPGRTVEWSPPVPPELWSRITDEWSTRLGPFDDMAVYVRPQSQRSGIAGLLLRRGKPLAFVKLRAGDDAPLRRETLALRALMEAEIGSFTAPRLLAEGVVDGWAYFATTALPVAPHRPATGAPLDSIVAELQAALTPFLPRNGGPDHWRPVHGDFTPWNLRAVPKHGLVLLDWEDVGWAPPGADLVLYHASVFALTGHQPPTWLSAPEAAEYWLSRSTPGRGQEVDKRLRIRRTHALRAMARRQPLAAFT